MNANRDLVGEVTDTLLKIRKLEPAEEATTQKILEATQLYQLKFAGAVSAMGEPGDAPRERIEAVIANYERNLNGLVEKDTHKSRARLVDELRSQVGSFDTEITKTEEEFTVIGSPFTVPLWASFTTRPSSDWRLSRSQTNRPEVFWLNSMSCTFALRSWYIKELFTFAA